MIIYGDRYSGNCYKLQLACALLDIAHQWRDVDILRGETRADWFLALNPNGQIPVCVTDDGETLAESNAILYYLARDSRLWPADRLAQTRVLQWLFFEQYTHEPNIAVARFIRVYQGMPAERADEYRRKLAGGYRALALMNEHLAARPWLVGAAPTIADLSLFAYTHVAGEGGYDLGPYAALRDWIARVRAEPGFVALPPAAER